MLKVGSFTSFRFEGNIEAFRSFYKSHRLDFFILAVNDTISIIFTDIIWKSGGGFSFRRIRQARRVDKTSFVLR